MDQKSKIAPRGLILSVLQDMQATPRGVDVLPAPLHPVAGHHEDRLLVLGPEVAHGLLQVGLVRQHPLPVLGHLLDVIPPPDVDAHVGHVPALPAQPGQVPVGLLLDVVVEGEFLEDLLPEGKYVRLTGYPCSWTFYHHLRQEILQEFFFHDHVKEEANRYLAGLRGQRRNVTYVGVHVRRGDYVWVMPQVWKGVVADKAYLEKAMGYFRDKYQEPVFVVTSNGMEWCRENIDTSQGDVYFSGEGKESSPGRDFALLAHCNHTIMTIGTFGIWAGYLAGGETIYLANYTLPDSPFLRLFKPAAAFLPQWIGIDADLSPLRTGTTG
uniref:L-Fucosyltransferase n=1 Tax=Chrysemys picta bellii TaxID=8478 RepID=A0A8C3HNQ6_CHRPI